MLRWRVFTTAGSNYREGMVLTRGQYEVAVEAGQHAPFRRRLTVDGPTAYRISLCKLESRQQSICENKPVTRYRTETKESIRTMAKRDSFSVNSSDSTGCWEALGKLAKEMDVRGGLGLYEHAARVTDVEYFSRRYMRRRCRQGGGAFVSTKKRVGENKSWAAKTSCSCTRIRSFDYRCKVSMTWRCRYNTTVKIPYPTTEKDCRNISKTERVCPEKAVVRLK